MLLCYGISCFLAFVNVMYVTPCNGIKSGIVVRFEEITFPSEIMAVYILHQSLPMLTEAIVDIQWWISTPYPIPK